MRQRRSRFGFTLIEVALVLAIIGIGAALAIPSFLRARRNAQLDNRARELMSMVTLAQTAAVTGRNLTGVAPGVVGQATQGGVRFVDADTYVVFVDNDGDPGAVEQVAVVELGGVGAGGLASEGAGYDVTVESVTVGANTESPPGGIEFRFRNDATIFNSDNVSIQLVDQQLRKRSTIQISVAGQATVDTTYF